MRISPALFLSLLTLGGGVAVLAHGLNWQPDISSPAVESAVPPQALQAASSSRIGGETQVQVLTGRPLFTAGRRPHQPETVAAEEAQQTAVVTDLIVPKVRGIGLSGRNSVAIVSLHDEESRLHRIALGSEIDGWRITAIRRQSVTFSKATAEAIVHLGKPGGEPVVEIVKREPELAEEIDAGSDGAGSDQRM